MPDELFSYIGSVSRFWLPPLLNNLAHFPPALLHAEGCSIFIRWNGRLHLAATTRQGLRSRLFDESVSYGTSRWNAPEVSPRSSEQSGLTAWAFAYNTVLNIPDLRSKNAFSRYRAEGRPAPIWSDRARGFFDWEGPRPLLIAPMRDSEGEAVGAIRVYRIQDQAQPFNEHDEQELLAFGRNLAQFLEDHRLLDGHRSPGLAEVFRIWACQDAESIIARIVAAIPGLFPATTCSFFRRDGQRFVLRAAGCHPKLEGDAREHFEEFLSTNRGNLYYVASTESKTGTCIKQQSPLLLKRTPGGVWASEFSGGTLETKEEVHGQYLKDRPDISCELSPSESRSILVVPVRDHINPRMLAGVLRVVSNEDEEIDDKTVTEISHFADGLAMRLTETERQRIEVESGKRLIRGLKELARIEDRWPTIIRIVAEAVDADAVSVFLRRTTGEGVEFRSQRDYSYLNVPQLEQDQVGVVLYKDSHQDFLKNLPAYRCGQGRTGWVGQEGKTLNLKDLHSKDEIKLHGVRKYYSGDVCELPDAGPFLAVPVFSGSAITAVIRAVRRKEGPRGTFTEAHEGIFNTLAEIVAGFGHALAANAARVVISCAFEDGQVSRRCEEVAGFLRSLGIQPLYLRRRSDGGLAEFKKLRGQANAAIVIATKSNGRDLSAEVQHELEQCCRHLPQRTLVLTHLPARLPEGLCNDNTWLPKLEIRIPESGDRSASWPDLVAKLMPLLGVEPIPQDSQKPRQGPDEGMQSAAVP